ncbi:MAG: hypothetical protein LBO62_05430 [Endomicrobium sp.]|jgi:hypothetical protein|nr:hypothetical protein [Endomicrobium sp.]
MKKVILFAAFISVLFCLMSCEERKDYPLSRVEIWESGKKVSWIPNIVIGSTYTFTAKFFNSKSQEVQAPHPENVFWIADEATASSATFTPTSGVTTSYVMTDYTRENTSGKIRVEYENLNSPEITVLFIR